MWNYETPIEEYVGHYSDNTVGSPNDDVSNPSVQISNFIFIPDHHEYIKIRSCDIFYLEADGSYVKVVTQKKKYEDYFNTLAIGAVDNQAIYAYNSILKTLLDIREKLAGGQAVDIDRPKIFLEDLEFVAGVMKEIDPEGLKVLGKNFDTIVKRFKERHAKAA